MMEKGDDTYSLHLGLNEELQVLDVGTSKVAALIALVGADGEPRVIGTGQKPCAGLRRGLVTDFEKTEAAIRGAMDQAERAARVAAGKPPIACVPEGESVGIMDMLDGLNELPASYRKRPLKDGYARVLANLYPCR